MFHRVRSYFSRKEAGDYIDGRIRYDVDVDGREHEATA